MNENRSIFPERVQILIELLGEPEEGELNYTGKKREMSRLDALREQMHLGSLSVLKMKELFQLLKGMVGLMFTFTQASHLAFLGPRRKLHGKLIGRGLKSSE